MSESINIKRVVTLDFESAINKISEALKLHGFGVLTRIDLDSKIREKIGKDLPRVTILGACNPSLAYEAYKMDTDVASLLPCNAVVRALEGHNVSIELAKPSTMMRILGNRSLEILAKDADERVAAALSSI